MFSELDSYAVWKAIAVILTGLFAILGFATEARDRLSKRLTVWGWVSVVGAIIASAGGVIVQIHDSNDEKHRRDQEDLATKAILGKLDQTLVRNSGILDEVLRATSLIQRISGSVSVNLNLSGPLLKSYSNSLKLRVEHLEDAVQDAGGDLDAVDETDGLVATGSTMEIGRLDSYKIPANSPAFPAKPSYGDLGKFFSNYGICLAAKVGQVDLSTLSADDFDQDSHFADLRFCIHFKFGAADGVPDGDILQLRTNTVLLDNWYASGRIVSQHDLDHATVIVYPDERTSVLSNYWNSIPIDRLQLVINRTPFNLDLGKGLEEIMDLKKTRIYIAHLSKATPY